MTTYQTPAAASPRGARLIPAALIVLGFVPVLAGALRVTELAAGAQITAANARFFAMPVPVVLHIVGASVFSVVGAFQFAPGLRRRRPRWHRVAGRVLVPSGLVAALSGLWMTVFFPVPAEDQGLLTAFRLMFGTGMAVSLALGLAAIRRRDVARHRAWMTRGYALGLGAGTQAATALVWVILHGGAAPEGLARQLLLGASWAINLAVAEWAVRRGRRVSS
ncbi:MAG TPA: DUF2306 domain-containing protein [Nonomuraea sp.]|nr:DUF2306 domain-containing protein [Nonomuraea sp.]